MLNENIYNAKATQTQMHLSSLRKNRLKNFIAKY